MRRHPQNEEDTCRPRPGRGFVCRLYKGLRELQAKRTMPPKRGRRTEQTFLQRGHLVADDHMRTRSTSSGLRETPGETPDTPLLRERGLGAEQKPETPSAGETVGGQSPGPGRWQAEGRRCSADVQLFLQCQRSPWPATLPWLWSPGNRKRTKSGTFTTGERRERPSVRRQLSVVWPHRKTVQP